MKNFLFLTPALFALSSSAYANCARAQDVNTAIANSTTYESFKENMNKYGRLLGVTSAANFHLSDWEKFKGAIAATPFRGSHAVHQACQYSIQSKKGLITINLGQKKN